MAKKDYFCIVDTETTQDATVADFGAVVCDRKGKIYASCGVLVKDHYDTKELFHNEKAGELWNSKSLKLRHDRYDMMLNQGSRMLGTVTAINRWLAKAVGQYDPILTAYNLSFDTGKCNNTGIDLTQFSQSFCLMNAAKYKWMGSKKYLNFVLKNHLFNNPSKLRNMSWSYKAENMARFVLNNPDMEDEPHTALEDAQFYELPILVKLVNTTKRKDWMTPEITGWQQWQVKDYFKVK